MRINRHAYDTAAWLVHTKAWTVDPHTGTVRGRNGRPIGSISGRGYLRAPLNVAGHQRFVYLHRVVYEATYGPIPEGLEIDHINGQKTDNRLCNLELVTSAENTRRARATGLLNDVGYDNPRASMNPHLVDHLRRVGARSGMSYRQLSNWYKVSPSTIGRVLTGRRYAG